MDAETQAPIPDVYVLVNNDRVAGITDNGGYFMLNLEVGPHLLEFRHVAYQPKLYAVKVQQRQGQMLLIEMKPRLIQLPEVTVTERLDRLTLLDERNTYAVIQADQILKSRAANVREALTRLAPSAAALYSAAGFSPNQLPPTLYINGILTESWVAELIDVSTIDKILVWRTSESPVEFRTGRSRYLIDIRTKTK